MVKRLIALIIDLMIFALIVRYLFLLLVDVIGSMNYNFLLFSGIFIFYFFILESIWLTSPGKWLLNLRIVSIEPNKINRLNVIFRSVFKFAMIFSLFGVVITFFSWLSVRYVWYDKLLGLNIIDNSDGKLTAVQKNWRKHFKLFLF